VRLRAICLDATLTAVRGGPQAPHETFRAAAHLVVSGTMTRHPRVALLLAHMGGSALALAPRIAALAAYMGAPLSAPQILAEFRRCWWDSALAGGVPAAAARAFGVEGRVVWGSDFPGACFVLV
jgi:predicted TIM-barrel fold metal-dependent hydrolase